MKNSSFLTLFLAMHMKNKWFKDMTNLIIFALKSINDIY